MGTVKERLADDNAAYFSDMARRYQSLALVERHQAQSDLFATIAADYSELAAEAAACEPRMVAVDEPVDPASFVRWVHWVGRWRRPAAPLASSLPLPAVPTGAK